MKRTLLVFSTCLALCAAVSADSWVEKDHVETWRFQNGSLRIDVVNDAKNKYEARRYVKMVRGSRVVMMLNGAGFDTLVASPNETFFVGLSNSGLDRTALMVFGADGAVYLLVSHGAAQLDYCQQSITVIQEWHGSRAEDVHFEDDKGMAGVSLLDCRGKRVNLLDVVSEAFIRDPIQYRAWKKEQEMLYGR